MPNDRRPRVLGAVVAGLACSFAGGPAAAETSPLTKQCLMDAAHAFDVAPRDLALLLKVERGEVGHCHRNKNRTEDCGPAQINIEAWRTKIGLVLGIPAEDVKPLVRDNGCANISIAAWIFHGALQRAQGDVVKAYGYYNAPTNQAAQQIYEGLVIDQFAKALKRSLQAD